MEPHAVCSVGSAQFKFEGVWLSARFRQIKFEMSLTGGTTASIEIKTAALAAVAVESKAVPEASSTVAPQQPLRSAVDMYLKENSMFLILLLILLFLPSKPTS